MTSSLAAQPDDVRAGGHLPGTHVDEDAGVGRKRVQDGLLSGDGVGRGLGDPVIFVGPRLGKAQQPRQHQGPGQGRAKGRVIVHHGLPCVGGPSAQAGSGASTNPSPRRSPQASVRTAPRGSSANRSNRAIRPA